MYNSNEFGPCDTCGSDEHVAVDSLASPTVRVCFRCQCANDNRQRIAKYDQLIAEFEASPLTSPLLDLPSPPTLDQRRRLKKIMRSTIEHFGRSMTVDEAIAIGSDPVAHARRIGAVYETRSFTGGAMWGVSRVGASDAEWRSEWWAESYAFAGGAVCVAIVDAAARGALCAIVDGHVVPCKGTLGTGGVSPVAWTAAVDQSRLSASIDRLIGA